jgi:hypothetical protein
MKVRFADRGVSDWARFVRRLATAMCRHHGGGIADQFGT